jgi:hypothetical protein
LTTGLVVLAITFGYGLSCTAWARFAATRVVLAGAGRLPWRTMRFLADAHRRGVLRRSGGSYWRHVLTRTNTDAITEVEMVLQCQNLLLRVHYLGKAHIPLAHATQLSGDVLEQMVVIAVPRT